MATLSWDPNTKNGADGVPISMLLGIIGHDSSKTDK